MSLRLCRIWMSCSSDWSQIARIENCIDFLLCRPKWGKSQQKTFLLRQISGKSMQRRPIILGLKSIWDASNIPGILFSWSRMFFTDPRNHWVIKSWSASKNTLKTLNVSQWISTIHAKNGIRDARSWADCCPLLLFAAHIVQSGFFNCLPPP